MVDAVLLGLFLTAYFFNKRTLPALCAYFCCVLYQISPLFEYHNAVYIHVIYGSIFIPCIYFATLRQSIAMLAYSIFHWFVAFDYLANPTTDTLISIYYNEAQILLALSIILSGYRWGYNDDSDTQSNSLINIFTLDNLWNSKTRTRQEKET